MLITGATFFTYAGFIFFNAIYLQDVRGYSALAAGVLTLPAAVPAVIGGPLGGYLVGTRGPRGVLIGGTLALAAGVGLLSQLTVHAPLGWLLTSYVVIGAGYAVLNAPVSTVAVSSMPRDQAGVAAAVASSARNVGIVFGIAVLGTIVNGHVPAIPGHGASEATLVVFRHAYVHALHIAYLVAAGVVIAAAIVAALTMRPTPPGASA